MAVEIDESAVGVDFTMTQGDAWPDEPCEFAVTEDDETTPITGLIASVRLQVRDSYEASSTRAALDSTEDGSPLTISEDQSTVLLAAAAVPGSVTTDWPAVDLDLKPKDQTPLVWDVEVIYVDTGAPDTLFGGRIYVRPQVTR